MLTLVEQAAMPQPYPYGWLPPAMLTVAEQKVLFAEIDKRHSYSAEKTITFAKQNGVDARPIFYGKDKSKWPKHLQ